MQVTKDFYPLEDLLALKAFMRSGSPLVVGVDRASDIQTVLDLGADFDLPLILIGVSEAWKVRDQLARQNVSVIIDPLNNLPGDFGRLGARLDNAALVAAAGVRVALTVSDSQNARLLRQVAGNAVAHGMPWIQAFAAISSTPARIWGLEKSLGTLETGRAANLVIWSGDPLEVTNWAEKVMANGQWVPMRSRQTRLYERYQSLDSANKPFGYR